MTDTHATTHLDDRIALNVDAARIARLQQALAAGPLATAGQAGRRKHQGECGHQDR